MAQPSPKGPAPPPGPGVRFVSELHAGMRPDAHACTTKHSQAVDPGTKPQIVRHMRASVSVYSSNEVWSVQLNECAQMKPQVHQNLSRQTFI